MQSPTQNPAVIHTNSGQLTNGNQVIPVGVKLLDRGMNKEECKIMCTHHSIPDRERLFSRIIYETLMRPWVEVLNLKIEDWDRHQRLITAVRVKMKTKPQKGDRHKKDWLPSKPRTAILSERTNELLREYVGNRKKGYIFTNEKGTQLSKTHFKEAINYHASKLGLQQVVQYYETRSGEIHAINLITCMALREAGERHHDIEGGDRKLSAILAGHTMEVKNRHYGKPDYEEVHESMKSHHPAFTEGW